MTSVHIHGNNQSILSVNLTDILTCIVDGDNFYWKMLWLEASGKQGFGSVIDIEDNVNNSASGLLMNWNELNKISTKFNIINVLIIGDIEIEALIRYRTDEEMYSRCQFCIELIDSSFWKVHCKINNYIANFLELQGATLIID